MASSASPSALTPLTPSPDDLPELVHGSCSCTPLFCPTPSCTDFHNSSLDDSPSMPWRPGSSAYPPAPSEDRYRSRLEEITKLELQRLYDSLTEGSYDLSLRDIVEPPFSINGMPAPSTSPDEHREAQSGAFLPHSRSRKAKAKPYVKLHHHHHQQHHNLPCLRSHSCRRSDSKYASSSSPNSKLAFSFSFPRRTTVLFGPAMSSSPPKKDRQKLTLLSSCPKVMNQKSTPSSSPERCGCNPSTSKERSPQNAKQGQASLQSVVTASPKKPSFKRSTSAHHRSALLKTSQIDKISDQQTPSSRAPFYVGGPSRSRVHPSSQCSACASYTIFFKSRCMVCGKPYCSNCAKDAMDHDRRCRTTCTSSTRVGSKRFSRGVKSKCWPLCGNVDVSKSPSKCKLSSKE